MDKYKAVVLDDEPLARQDLIYQLYNHPEIEVVAEAETIEEAVETINEHKPHIVFLDVNLVEETSFRLFDEVEVDFAPVFVTAFSEYAVKAFEVEAFDYLMKPVKTERLAETVLRIKEKWVKAYELQDNKEDKLAYDQQVPVKVGNQIKVISLNSLIYITAAEDYTHLYLNTGEKPLVLKTISKWEEILPSKQFLRVHRSVIININYVEKLEQPLPKKYFIYMKNISEPLNVSRKLSKEIKNRLGLE
ncbi:MAG: LytTR family DNA-binding domain-containing protein [Blastocatellia bacterium]